MSDKPTPVEKVTAHILSAMETAGTWTPPWDRIALCDPRNAVTGHLYQGINVISCWVSQQLRGYETQLWASYQQWGEVGAQVNKGEKGTPIVFWKKVPRRKNSEGEDHGDGEGMVWIAKSYTIFNRDQVSNPPPLDEAPVLRPEERIAAVDEWLEPILGRARVEHRDCIPHYQPSTDAIALPPMGRFHENRAYYGTLFHELIHWTKTRDRCDRPQSRTRQEYAAEELVAELGAAFLCARHGIATPERDAEHAAYLASWFTVLKKDPKKFSHAASEARKAADYLNALADEQMKEAA